jgi:uncharacterized membrane protein
MGRIYGRGYWTLKPATCIMTVALLSTLASIQTPFILASVSMAFMVFLARKTC